MKKTYVKPTIFFEGFTLSTAIAADCGTTTDLQSQNICGMEFGNLTVFLDTMNGCTFKINSNGSGDGSFNGVCYHVPTGSSNLFNS